MAIVMTGGQLNENPLSVAANGVSPNIYGNKTGEFAAPGVFRMRASAATVGLTFSLLVNGVVIYDDQPISDSNRWPQLPEDLVIQSRIGGGRLIGRFRNTTGAAINVKQVTELLD